MPGIVGVIARDRSNPGDLKTQFSRMVRLLSHLDYYRSEVLENRDHIIGRVGIPHRGYRHVRRDDRSGNEVVFDGYLYGWHGQCASAAPWTKEPVSLVPLENGGDLGSVPPQMNGSYTVCLHDAARDEFHLATDRLGFHRLYYYQDDRVIAFAPEIKAFMGLDSFRPEVDPDGLADYFNYNFLIGGRTLYKGVRLLHPASTLKIAGRALGTPARYWNWRCIDGADDDPDRLMRRMYEIGREVLGRQMGQHERFILALSGGMDSRLAAHHAVRTGRDFRFYSHGHRRSEDALIAREVATKLGVGDHYRHIDVDPRCYARLGAFTAWLADGMVFTSTAPLVDVVRKYGESPLEYEFMNSMIAGAYVFESAFGIGSDLNRDMPEADRVRRIMRVFGAQYVDPGYYRLFTPDYANRFRELFDQHVLDEYRRIRNGSASFLDESDLLFAETRILRLSIQYDHNKFFFHDHHVFEDDSTLDFYMQMPARWKADRSGYKKLFRDLVPDMAAITYQKTGVDLYHQPDPGLSAHRERMNHLRYLATRLSMGQYNPKDYHTYVFPDAWYREYPENRHFYERILLDPRTAARGYYNMAAVRRLLWKQAIGSASYNVIAGLATFELFNRYFIDGETPPTLRV